MKDTNDLKQGDCPDRESVLSVIEGGNVPSDRAGEILNHLSTCAECRQAVAFVCAAVASERRQKPVRTAFSWSRVLSAIDPWASREEDEMPDALAAAAPRRVLAFVSVRRPAAACVWQAEVRLPAPDDPDGELQVAVRDGGGHPLHGRFRLCGVECDVGDGKASVIKVRDFRENHSTGGVAFAEAGKPFAEGVPILSSIL